MLKYTFGRILSGLVTIWFIATATFLAMHAVPGDPLMNEKATTPEIRANLARKYGLDKPIAEQYIIYLSNMVQGDFGISFTQQNRKVNDIIQDHFPVSAALGILAITFAALGGILWGALTALYRNQLPDIIIMFLVILGISVPSFVFAALGQLLLVNINQWFDISFLPVAGWGTFAHMIMPSLVLGLGTMALLTRLMRSAMLEIVNEDFIRTAPRKRPVAKPDIFSTSAPQCHSAGGHRFRPADCGNYHGRLCGGTRLRDSRPGPILCTSRATT